MEKHGNTFDSYRMGAMDIACGYHSYLFAIARWQLQVSDTVFIQLLFVLV